MINIYKPGDTRRHSFIVKKEHFPTFQDNIVHEVCSTYALAREIEWSTRLFVIDMIETDEEGIGTMIHLDHLSPAFEGNEITIEAKVESMEGNKLICSFQAFTKERQIAKGKTGQKILKKEEIRELFSDLSK